MKLKLKISITIESHGLDFIKIVNKYKDHEVQILNVTSIAISAARTAYGRIHISRFKSDILNKGGQLYYSDTDSIVTNLQLDDNMVNNKELGKLKLEHKIDRAIFISGKIYCFFDNKGNFINRAKGVKSTSLSYPDYMELLNNNNVKTAVKSESKINWQKGDVKIQDKQITLYSSSFTKRTKIFINGKWVDTRPIYINDLVKDLIIYNQVKDLIVINTKKYSNITDNENKKVLAFSLSFLKDILLYSLSGLFILILYILYLYTLSPDDEEERI